MIDVYVTLEGVHGGPGVGAVDADGADALVAGVLAQAQAVVLTEAENKIRAGGDCNTMTRADNDSSQSFKVPLLESINYAKWAPKHCN